MSSEEQFRKRLEKMQRWVEKCSQVWQRALSDSESQYVRLVQELEESNANKQASLKQEEETLRAQIDEAGKEFARNKYKLERDATKTKAEIELALGETNQAKITLSSELERVKQEQLNNQISFEKQKSALSDLYQEKTRHLLVTREKLIRESAQANTNLKNYREKNIRETEALKSDYGRKIQLLKDQLQSKRDGWAMALDTLKKELDSLNKQKEDIEKKLATIQTEKEKDIETARLQMTIAKDQLEMDKATLIEKAEEDQRRCEAQVQELQAQITDAEATLQTLIVEKEKEHKNLEDSFQNEETLLKEAVKNESEKRDYEQKLYAQEKMMKEKELNRLREDYEKKKWHWDNQLRTLLMQKSVHDAEHDAERLRVDREARQILRNLEAKRDELKRRVADLKAKHDSLVASSTKEFDLMNQRWRWRKERIWSMWQSRLEVLKRERGLISEQLQKLEDEYLKEKAARLEEEKRQEGKIDDLRQYSMNVADRLAGGKKQRGIEIELEKTRLIAQIKECEILVSEWMDRQKMTQAEVAKRSAGFTTQMDFVDQLYKSEQHETELFLHSLRKAVAVLEGELERLGLQQDAA